MKKILIFSIVGLCLVFSCKDDTMPEILEPEIENSNEEEDLVDDSIPADYRCDVKYLPCERNANLSIIKRMEGAFMWHTGSLTLNGGEIVYLRDTTCINTICNQFELNLKEDSTFYIHFDVILPDEPDNIYSESIHGTYYVCWCYEHIDGPVNGTEEGEIVLLSNYYSKEEKLPFSKFVTSGPWEFEIRTRKGVFNIHLL